MPSIAMKKPNKQNVLAEEFTELLEHELCKLKLPAGDAKTIAGAIVRKVIDFFGGQLIYIPRNLMADVADRNAQILAKFDGSNHAELAREFGVSVQWIYKIVKNPSSD